MRSFLVLLLAAMFALPAAGAEDAPKAAAEGGSERCASLVGATCGVHARAAWSVLACDAASCRIQVHAEAWGWSQHPGWLRMETVTLADDLDCPGVGTPLGAVKDAACAELCRAEKASWTASCSGRLAPRVALAPGECAGLAVANRFANEATGAKAAVVFFTDACRDADGAVRFR